jgi:signal transduction histidine kinase
VLLARSPTRPIRALQDGADRIGAGDLEHRITVSTHDEVQALADRFNQMAGNLQASVSLLEQRVAERTRALAAANEAKSHFIAVASHDLRQPVHALGLFVGQLRGATEPAAQRELLQHIEHSVAAFEALLEALLDISRLDAGSVAVRRQPLALAPLLQRLARGQAELARRKGLRLLVRVLPQELAVESDPVLLERILGNLLGNALRYTARGGVLIAARRRQAAPGTAGAPGWVELRVIDSGQGITADELPLVFREFHRGPAQTGSDDPGLGLGLAIVRRLTDLLQYGLDLRSVPGRGTCFTLRLPLAQVAQPEALPAPSGAVLQLPAPDGAPDPLQGRRVLVIDDDAAVREAMRGQLQQWGLQVLQAADEDAAWAAFANPAAPPHAVLADLRLGAWAAELRRTHQVCQDQHRRGHSAGFEHSCLV